jgi:hypothetical protein
MFAMRLFFAGSRNDAGTALLHTTVTLDTNNHIGVGLLRGLVRVCKMFWCPPPCCFQEFEKELKEAAASEDQEPKKVAPAAEKKEDKA